MKIGYIWHDVLYPDGSVDWAFSPEPPEEPQTWIYEPKPGESEYRPAPVTAIVYTHAPFAKEGA